MRLLGNARVIGLVAAVLMMPLAGGVANAAEEEVQPSDWGFPCQMSRGYEGRVEELQELLDVTVDGWLWWETCTEVLKLHDVLIEIGEIPENDRGFIGYRTFKALSDPHDDVGAFALEPEESVAPPPDIAPVSTSGTDCSVKYNSTIYVICVDDSAQVGSVRSVNNGVVGDRVIGPFEVVTSQVLTYEKDTITRRGSHTVKYADDLTPKLGLKLALFFNGGQAVHSYHNIGPQFDSGGCVRVRHHIAEAIWELLVNSGLVPTDYSDTSFRVVEVKIAP